MHFHNQKIKQAIKFIVNIGNTETNTFRIDCYVIKFNSFNFQIRWFQVRVA